MKNMFSIWSRINRASRPYPTPLLRPGAVFLFRARPALSVICLFGLFIHSAAHAQVVTATLEGTAQDASGVMGAKAAVMVTNVSTNIVTSTETDANGRFVFASLAPGGPYSVTGEAPGFKT